MLAEVLRPVLPSLSEEIIDAIAHEVPEYARPMEGAFGRVVRNGVQRALRRFVEDDERSTRGVYFELGRGEMLNGRSLDALLSAYRIGARLAWRRFVEAGREAGVSPDELYAVGEAIFEYIDELSAESIDGYATAQSAAAGETARRRSQLVRLVCSDPPPADAEIAAMARELRWRAPRTLAVVVVDDTAPLAIDALAGIVDGRTVALVDGAATSTLRRQLRGRRAALGPTVALGQAAHSLARATLALARVDGEAAGFVVADDHLADLLLNNDPSLAAELSAAVLAPMRELTERSRERLTATLRAWLAEQGRIEATAARLGVHPQTVRYRLVRLRELFGGDLDDPDRRFRLELALRVAA